MKSSLYQAAINLGLPPMPFEAMSAINAVYTDRTWILLMSKGFSHSEIKQVINNLANPQS